MRSTRRAERTGTPRCRACNVFITGASSGIGAALARHYAAQGAHARAVRAARGDARGARDDAARGQRRHLCGRRARPRGARACRRRFHRALRRARRRHRQRRHLARHADRARRGPRRRSARCSTPTCSGLVHTFQPFLAPMRAARRRRARRHRERCRISRACRVGRVLARRRPRRSPTSRACGVELQRQRRRRGHDLSRLHRNADDRAQSVPDAVPAATPTRRRASSRARSSAAGAFYVLPWQMALVGRVLRCVPRPLYDAVFARAPRKRARPAERVRSRDRTNETGPRAAPSIAAGDRALTAVRERRA